MESLRDYWDVFRHDFAPPLLSAGVFAFILMAIFCARAERRNSGTSSFILIFAIIGCITGTITGNSREPSVAAVIPALLTFITALAGYAFAKESLRSIRPVMPFCILSMTLTTFFCMSTAKQDRYVAEQEREKAAFERQKELLQYEKVVLEVEKAQSMKDKRS